MKMEHFQGEKKELDSLKKNNELCGELRKDFNIRESGTKLLWQNQLIGTRNVYHLPPKVVILPVILQR